MSTAHYFQTLHDKLTEVGELQAHNDLIEELHAHLQEAADDLQRAGTSLHDSEGEALRRLGTPDQLVEAVRVQQRERRIRSSGWRTRSFVGALLVAATMAIVAGGTVVTATTTGSQTPPTRHVQAPQSASPAATIPTMVHR